MAFEELQVPDEAGVWFCARHKSVRTRLRCGRCEKPICPKCTVMAPTGARCRDCVSNRDAHIYQTTPKHLALAFGAATVVGALGVFLTSIAGAFWLWVLLYAPAIGPLLGRLVSKITGGKRGPKVAFIVSAGLFCGAFMAGFGAAYVDFLRDGIGFGYDERDFVRKGILPLTGAERVLVVLLLTLVNVPLWVFLVIAIGGAWWWLK